MFRQYLTKKNLLLAVLCAALVTAGFFTGWQYGDVWFGDGPHQAGREIREGGYKLINPLLECETGKEILQQRELLPFKNKVEALIKKTVNGSTVQHVSVYFRDLNDGPWFSINGSQEYSPASLLKVVTLISCLKEAERNPGLLQRKVLYKKGDEDANIYESIKPAKFITQGNYYTVDELLALMIEHSDNNATRLLLSVVDPRVYQKTYVDLGLNVRENQLSLGDFMSVVTFASTFRVLFNASYLNREMSEKALGYLSRVEFKQGIVAGLSGRVPVAHKFGERVLGAHQEIKQLHDCGIVYYPQHPYMLCVMSRGNSFEYLDDAIQAISRLIFEEVDRQQHQ